MDFIWEGQPHQLEGMDSKPIRPTELSTLAKEVKQGNSLFAICLQCDAGAEIPTEMQPLLQEFEDVCQELKQLPPSREIDHYINLKEGTEPVNVRPYRYAHFQKAEIEKQVQDMLNMGLIRTSTSPFSSPILLVKKKDGTWRFCTDYRALNAVTIKDRFPIPTVEDMLDELHGAALLNWIWCPAITRCEFILLTLIRQHSAHTMAIMNIWSCPSDCVMLLQLFNLL